MESETFETDDRASSAQNSPLSPGNSLVRVTIWEEPARKNDRKYVPVLSSTGVVIETNEDYDVVLTTANTMFISDEQVVTVGPIGLRLKPLSGLPTEKFPSVFLSNGAEDDMSTESNQTHVINPRSTLAVLKVPRDENTPVYEPVQLLNSELGLGKFTQPRSLRCDYGIDSFQIQRVRGIAGSPNTASGACLLSRDYLGSGITAVDDSNRQAYLDEGFAPEERKLLGEFEQSELEQLLDEQGGLFAAHYQSRHVERNLEISPGPLSKPFSEGPGGKMRGGPLLNGRGEMVGLVHSVLNGAQGIDLDYARELGLELDVNDSKSIEAARLAARGNAASCSFVGSGKWPEECAEIKAESYRNTLFDWQDPEDIAVNSLIYGISVSNHMLRITAIRGCFALEIEEREGICVAIVEPGEARSDL